VSLVLLSGASPPSSVISPRTGLVTLDGFTFSDDGGPYLALGTTMFWALWGWIMDRARMLENVDFVRARGVDYVRVLALVGPEGWSDRTVTPDDLVHVGECTKAIRAHGLRTKWTIFGGVDLTPDPASRRSAVEAFCEQLVDLQDAVQLVEVANEGWQNGFPGNAGAAELRSLAALVHERLPHVQVSLTAPQTADHTSTEALYARSVATVACLHLERNTAGTGGMWRPVRQAWEMAFAAPSWARENGEPIGPQSSVAEDDDPLRLTMSGALTWLCGGCGYCLHTGAGIRGGGAEDLARGRVGNFWEVTNIEQTLAGLRASRALLPATLPNWDRHNTNRNFPDYPFEMEFAANGGWVFVDDGRLLRAFAATGDDGTVIVGPIVATVDIPFVAKWGLRLRQYNPLTGALVKEQAVAAGQTYTLAATDAAIIIGEPT
jgi:hypothetical protein